MQTTRKLLCMVLAVLLSTAAFSPAMAQQTGQESTAYLVVGSKYALNESGQATLYSDDGAPIGTVANGARLTVTNGQRDGRTFVRFGAVTGWIDTADLSDETPALSPAPGLVPIQTDPPADEPEADVLDTPEANEETAAGSGTADSAEAPAIETDEEGTDNSSSGVHADAAENEEDNVSGEEPGVSDGDEADSDLSDDAPSDAVPSAGDEETAPETSAEGRNHPDLHDPIPAMLETDAGEPEAVSVVRLGVVYSLVDTAEGIVEAETALLTFAEEIPEEKKLGYVHAPRTGQAGLREAASKSSKVLTQLKAGQIVAVLALEEDFAHVNVQGQEGWLRLDCLRYFQMNDERYESADSRESIPTASGKPDTPEHDTEKTGEKDVLIAIEGQPENREDYPRQAVLSCQGETGGETSVNLRNAPTKDSAKTAVWRTGEEVTVLSGGDGWYLAEARGICGYVMESFLSFE